MKRIHCGWIFGLLAALELNSILVRGDEDLFFQQKGGTNFCKNHFPKDVIPGQYENNIPKDPQLLPTILSLFRPFKGDLYTKFNVNFFSSSLYAYRCIDYLSSIDEFNSAYKDRIKILTHSLNQALRLYNNDRAGSSFNNKKIFFIVDLPGVLSLTASNHLLEFYNTNVRNYELIWKIKPYSKTELKLTDELGGYNTIRAIKNYASSLAQIRAKPLASLNTKPLPLFILDSTRDSPYMNTNESASSELLSSSDFPNAEFLKNSGVNTIVWLIDNSSWGIWNYGTQNKCFLYSMIKNAADIQNSDLSKVFTHYLSERLDLHVFKLNSSEENCK